MSIEAHFNGEVFVPDGPVDMPVGQKVRVPWNRNPRTALETGRISKRFWKN